MLVQPLIHTLHYQNKSEHRYLNNILLCMHINNLKHQIDTGENSNDECILLSEMQHSQPHITLYCAKICFNCCGNSERNVE